jgi:hypothetical protein
MSWILWLSKSGGQIDTRVDQEVAAANLHLNKNPAFPWWLEHVFINGSQQGGVEGCKP